MTLGEHITQEILKQGRDDKFVETFLQILKGRLIEIGQERILNRPYSEPVFMSISPLIVDIVDEIVIQEITSPDSSLDQLVPESDGFIDFSLMSEDEIAENLNNRQDPLDAFWDDEDDIWPELDDDSPDLFDDGDDNAPSVNNYFIFKEEDNNE